MPIDVEGLLFVLARFEEEEIPVDDIVSTMQFYEIESTFTRAVLQQALDSGRLEWAAPGDAVRRPA